MSNNSPSIDELRDSFERVYDGPDRLRREYDLVMESERLGVHIDTYRRLYELRGEEEIDPYPKPKKWWHTPGEWSKWVWHLPTKKKLALSRKGVFKLVQSGVILTIAIGIGRYVWEAPKREKATHYQAWQMINSAAGQKSSGGRIEALQDLVKDKVDLSGLDASGANLYGIKLQYASLRNANLSKAVLIIADLSGAELTKSNLNGAVLAAANLSHTTPFIANLSNALLVSANLSNANLVGSDLSNANLGGTNLKEANLGCIDIAEINGTERRACTNFRSARDITPEQIKQAQNWQQACYDPDFRIKLGLPPQNPKYCAGEKPAK